MPGPVVVDERVGGPVDPAGGPAHVQRLTGVLLQVHTLDADPHPLRLGVTLVHQHVEPAVDAQRLVVLGDLEVLGHVRVEVVLPREPAPLRDRAVQRQPDPDGELDRGLGRYRQRTGQAEADRADVRVRLPAELDRAAAEQLGQRAQLDVRLQADRRLVTRQRLRVRHQWRGRGHRPAPFVSSSSPLAAASSGWPQRSVNAASAAAATR